MPALPFRFVLFDLDGTLIDPEEGICGSVRYALSTFGIKREAESLTSFIGPPLIDSFREQFGMDDAEAWKAVEAYRVHFAREGVHQNTLYPHVTQLLYALRRAGATVALATSKPEPYARQILFERGIARFFDTVAGATMGGARVEKAEVVAEALARLGNPPTTETAMAGDRKHDIEGARAAGMVSIGVAWGFAPAGEFEAARPTHLARTMDDLGRLLGVQLQP